MSHNHQNLIVFPRIIARAIISFFAPKGGDYLKEGNYSRETIISNILTESRALNILFYFPIKSKNNHIKETKYGLFRLPNLVP